MVAVTFRGVFRDRVFQGILMAALVFLAIPSVSSLSMRQVTELSLTLSLSLVSFMLLLLSVFLGGTSLWRDIERRYSLSVLGLPMTRTSYLVGKFAGIAAFILLTTALLGIACCAVVWFCSITDPPGRPIIWGNVFCTLLFDGLKYTLLIAIAFLFSTVSTSFFLPIFGTISTFLVGSATQEVYDYIHTEMGQKLPELAKSAALALYYVLPNFAAFDLKVNAIYSIPLSGYGLLLTLGYFLVYTSIVLMVACAIFARREFV